MMTLLTSWQNMPGPPGLHPGLHPGLQMSNSLELIVTRRARLVLFDDVPVRQINASIIAMHTFTICWFDAGSSSKMMGRRRAN